MNNCQDFNSILIFFDEVNYPIRSFNNFAYFLAYSGTLLPDKGNFAIWIERLVSWSTIRRAYSGEVCSM